MEKQPEGHRPVCLSRQEAKDLVHSIMEAVAFHDDDGPALTADWPAQMRDWCDLLLSRLYDDEGGTTT